MQTKTDALGLSAKPNKTPWRWRFGAKMKMATTAVIVGIALLASPFLLQSDDEDDEIPKIKSIYVTNHGSTGFEIEVRLSSSFPYFVAEGYRSTLYERYWETTWRPRLRWRHVESSPSWDCGLCSNLVDWYEIPNYDESSGSESFDFLVALDKQTGPSDWSLGNPWQVIHTIEISFSVTTDDDGIRPISMSASADDSEGNSYDITVYYRYGPGGDFVVLP